MKMSAKVLANNSKTKSGNQRPDSNSEGSEIESENHLSQDDGSSNPHETDLFSFLSAMHLSGGGSGGLGGQMHPAAAQVLASRKRKLLDQSGGAHLGSGSGSGKLFGGMRPPGHRRNSDEEVPLHTPQCSQSGFADEEDRRHHQGEIESDDNDVQHHQHQQHHHHQGSSPYKSRQGTLAHDQHQQIGDIDENLAADFDGSLSGLGVDMNASTYSMSEALMALPNLSIGTGHMFKQEVSSPPTHHRLVNISHTSTPSRLVQCSLKEEPISNLTTTTSRSNKGNHSPSLDALDLSSDEAARFPESDSEDAILGPKTFAGSVSQDGSRNGTPTVGFYQNGSNLQQTQTLSFSGANLSSSHPNLTTIGKNVNDTSCSNMMGVGDNSNKSHKIIIPVQNQSSSSSLVSRKDSQELVPVDIAGNAAATGSKFQYVLNASTSIATKVNEPSITYINQGQSYELALHKIGDASTFRKRLLKCQLRVCFHERRLQYMEAEQIAEWSAKHPGERILDIDLPLSYGVIDPIRDPCNLNMITFKWDPTRDTGIYFKVNCISTEFTPKKHGGEKGVPFRLQVENFDPDDNRLHAAGCVIQVFKLKGADRKHKQDRDKIQKRTPAEQEKFARPYDKTILTDLPTESVYVPPSSRSDSPELVLINASTADSVLKTSHSRHSSREETSPAMYYSGGGLQQQYSTVKDGLPLTGLPVMASQCMATTSNAITPNMSANASVETVTQWLSRNRYSSLLGNFRNYNGRDLLRLSREDVISMCGLSDGIRLYNDLHMAPVAPRTTFYVALKDSNKYDALFLEELTVAELVKRFAQCVGLNVDLFGGVFKRVSQGFLVRVTNEVVQYTDPESVFYFTLRHSEDGSSDKCDIILEDAIHVLHDVLKNNPTSLEVNTAT